MKGSAAKIQMTSLDALFGGAVAQAAGDQIHEIPLTELYPFKDHPFHVMDDEKMQEMSESVALYGVLVPGIVRPRPEGGYEIVAGHRRKRASELAGKETMPVIVREMDNDEAIIIMVDSNLQREKILPSEKAFAYRMKLEAMKHQGQRPVATSVPVAQKSDGKTSRQLLAEQAGESQDQIRRYIRLTYLIPSLLQRVDENKLALRPAVELSYLTQEEQALLLEAVGRWEVTPSLGQAQQLKEHSKNKQLIRAIALAADFSIEYDSQIPDGVDGTYIPALNEARVREGQDAEQMCLSLLKEFCHYEQHKFMGKTYERNPVTNFVALCGGYVLARRFDINTENILFQREVFPEIPGGNVQERCGAVRDLLSSVIRASGMAGQEIQRGIAEMERLLGLYVSSPRYRPEDARDDTLAV